MRRVAGLLPALAPALATGCDLPIRDNPNDPAVRPVPVLQVAIDGTPSDRGGRNAQWQLDASDSSDPDDGIRHYRFFLDREGAELGPFLAADGGPLLTPADAAFGEVLLTALGTDSMGAVTFLATVEVEDDAGHRERSESRPFTVENRAPSVEIGPPLRIAPGGKWWSAGFSPEPWTVRIEAEVEDPDVGDAALASDPGIYDWHVEGHLAAVLDLDADGRVDEPFLRDGRSAVEFAAPIDPQQGEIRVVVTDCIAEGCRGVEAMDGKRVDVLTSHWVLDQYSGILTRLDASQFASDRQFTRILAVQGSQVLAVEFLPGADSGDLVILELGLQPGVRRNVFPDLSEGAWMDMSAAPDGQGGWWVLVPPYFDPDSKPYAGTGVLRRFDRELDDIDSFSEVAGDPKAGADFEFAQPSMVVRAPGSSDVWAVAGDRDARADRVLRVSTSGTLVAEATFVMPLDRGSLDAPGITALAASEEDGSIWISATGEDVMGLPISRIARVSASGDATGIDEVLECAGAVVAQIAGAHAILPVSSADGRVLVAFGDVAFRGSMVVDSAGVSLCQRIDASVYKEVLPAQVGFDDAVFAPLVAPGRSPGTSWAVISVGQPVTDTFVLEVDALLDPLEIIRIPALDADSVNASLALIADRYIIAGDGTSTDTRLFWVETLEPSPRLEIAIPGLPVQNARARFAVDAATGDVFAWDRDCGCVRHVVPDGTVHASYPLSIAGVPLIAEDVMLAMDPERRRLWGAASPGPSAEGSRLFRIDVDTGAVTEIEPPDGLGFTFVNDLDVAIAPSASADEGYVCVGGLYPSYYSPAQNAFTSVALDVFVRALTAASSDGACWFTAESAAPIDVVRAPTGPDLDSGGERIVSLEGGWGGESNRAWFVVEDPLGGPSSFIGYFAPDKPLGANFPSAPIDTTGLSQEWRSIAIDPYYNHVIVTDGSGLILRLDHLYVESGILTVEKLVEAARYEGFDEPYVRIR